MTHSSAYRTLLLDPYHGGSHRYVTEQLAAHLPGSVDCFTLPARRWKWRMSAAAIAFADRLEQGTHYDLLIATDMLDLSRFLTLSRGRSSFERTVLLMHENQLTMPRPEADREDLHLGLINVYSALAADCVWWNSAHHRDLFLNAVEALCAAGKASFPSDLADRVRARSTVLGLPLDLDELDAVQPPSRSGPLRIAWNHRMAYDKRPAQALAPLVDLAGDFEVHLFGPRNERRPGGVDAVLEALGERVVDHGFLDRPAYLVALAACDLILAWPAQEHFGLSVAEAVELGLWPILPNQLCYPELVPEEHHRGVLFDDDASLRALIAPHIERRRARTSGWYTRFAAPTVIDKLLRPESGAAKIMEPIPSLR
jgi:hypothetical protein